MQKILLYFYYKPYFFSLKIATQKKEKYCETTRIFYAL